MYLFCSQRLLLPLRILALTALALAVPLSRAQIAGTGTIQGTVTDPTGSFIPNATVTLTQQATQVKRVIQTDPSGVYIFPNIQIGTYTVNVTAAGFATFVQKNNVLEVGSNIAVNVQMKVGGKTETVEVQANGIALQTEDVSYKQTIDSQQITEMPINSAARQITGLLTVSGGTNPAPAGDFTGTKYSYQTISISVAGGSGNTTLWRLDGGDNNDYMANGNLPFPFPDAVSQFSVESTVLGAQDGMHSGGLVNVVTKSGTSTYHGSAFWFIRNNFIDATNFFATSKDTLHQNQYGGTFGGHIIRDKLFGFAAYQRLSAKQSSAATKAQIPTADNLKGDFSTTDPPPGAATNACAKPVQLLDPLTGAILPGNKYATPPTYNASSLALMKYLPKIDPELRHRQLRLRLLRYPEPAVRQPVRHAHRLDHQFKESLLRALLHRWLSVPGVLLADQHPHHHAVRQLATRTDVHDGRGLDDQLQHRELRACQLAAPQKQPRLR